VCGLLPDVWSVPMLLNCCAIGVETAFAGSVWMQC
jgi:hypothetical protein